MKKLLAIILISLMLLASCADPGSTENSNTVSTTDSDTNAAVSSEKLPAESAIPTNPTDYLIITECVPSIKDTNKEPIPKTLDSIVKLAGSQNNTEELYNAMKAHELTIPVKLEARYRDRDDVFENEFNSHKACIIDNKEEFKAYFEALTLKNYDNFFSNDFFENNFIIFCDIGQGPDCQFYSFEYGVDLQTKTLKLRAYEIEHEGWMGCLHDAEHTIYNLVMIPKDAITADSKLIPYGELNVIMSVEFTYN